MRASYWSAIGTHAWVGTQECLRDREQGCVNDHTGCLWNNGHKRCGHPAGNGLNQSGYDSPLRRRGKGNS
jgi:hypothetical protein